jgi:hypothetical protein
VAASLIAICTNLVIEVSLSHGKGIRCQKFASSLKGRTPCQLLTAAKDMVQLKASMHLSSSIAINKEL